ncbi:hypothetical protein TRIUR3_19788 [Triticum urartu]|uniref:Uncharacterized protein n=1 Tax=Triticum urartu TaxID=4572 RepID=M7YQA8_TRIUA|nr:hypothetical protein TRIUR3_19788 [Triticum urartu]
MAGAGGQFYIIISAMAQLLVAIMAQRSGTFINKQTSPSPVVDVDLTSDGRLLVAPVISAPVKVAPRSCS